MSEAEALRDQAAVFAENLTRTVRAVVPGTAPFRALGVSGSGRVSVRRAPDPGITLLVAGQPLLLLGHV